MTVDELSTLLVKYDGDTEVVVSGGYADEILRVSPSKLISFWGNDREVVALFTGSQIGRVE